MDGDSKFLFRESEFEGENFDAPGFVAKYRRVSSLESLREQLTQYCEALRQQLYVIINRDYKDFITIATKLDGVDSRVELLRKPLVDLRLDLSLLHDGLLSSRQAIQETMMRRSEASQRRAQLESALLCLEKLDVVESVVVGKPADGAATGSVAAGARTRRELALAVATAKKSGSPHFAVSLTAFDSSELERAAHALATAQSCLARLQQPGREGGSSSGNGGSSGAASSIGSGSLSSSLLALSKTLAQRVEALSAQLLQKIKARLGDVLTEASSTHEAGTESGASGAAAGAGQASDALRRSLSHCLRALSALGRGDVAEAALCESITPFLKTTLTLGRVDGAEGRGSYSGLRDALGAVLATLRRYALVLTMAEEAREGGGGADLVVMGAWVPVLALLQERFPALFSVGIASTMARCYRALEHFTESLVGLVDAAGAEGSGGEEDKRQRALQRVLGHPQYRALHSRWDLALYAQLRAREVSARLERACEMCLSGRLTANAFVATHSYEAEAAKEGTRPLVHTLTQAELAELRTAYGLAGDSGFRLPLLLVCAVEAATCLHPTVLLRPLSPELLVLSLRCLGRIEAHVAIALDVPTQAFPRGAASFPEGAGAVVAPATPVTAGAAATTAGGVGVAAVTPSKPRQPSGSTPIVANSTHPGVNVPAASTDELVLLCADLHRLGEWMMVSLLPRALELFPVTSSASLRALLASHAARLEHCRRAVFSRLALLVAAECKRQLSAVKAIAGKYRMTNKPAPEVASAYVASVLQPLGAFLQQHGDLVAPFAPRGQGGWDVALGEDVAGALLREVQQLLETVRKTDTTLQRRSKIKAAQGAMTDSEKIALQVTLDVRAFGHELAALGVAPEGLPSYVQLLGVGLGDEEN